MRRLREGLFFETDGSLNLSQILLSILVIVAAFGFVYELITGSRASLIGWTFLGGAISALLLGGLPIAKAKILSQSRMPLNFMKTLIGTERSTDMSEPLNSENP